DLFNKIKPPYNINSVSQKLAIEALDNITKVNDWIKETVAERDKLMSEIGKLPFITKVYPSDANFFLIKTSNPLALYNYLLTNKIIVRDRSKVELCEGCLRITVGTKDENIQLINALNNYSV
ncbi:MAG: aminotransferase class I/II-fold pyridoxal phosphate-dependent enzyme, partial [Bacteroidia bacterium]|nr:aminotransferase class I/II-fold pyridoxal phosphate-dependent enzyme [Bacteroidia bacterium]